MGQGGCVRRWLGWLLQRHALVGRAAACCQRSIVYEVGYAQTLAKVLISFTDYDDGDAFGAVPVLGGVVLVFLHTPSSGRRLIRFAKVMSHCLWKLCVCARGADEIPTAAR
uniref:Uncharacterized protein n=1 Tax=Setaria viridis TaxID=4556 RepID=A0A4V6D5K5_SETVI|nr:hypothetical protein SEVIR_6G194050v2 [Setaria viridis]